MKHAFCLMIIFTLMPTGRVEAQISSNDVFVLEQSVVASGGGISSADSFSVSGTPGQPIAGVWSTGPASELHGGFWNSQPLAPTAASVEIGGRVTAFDGRPIGNATITLTEASGASHSARTNPFGWYRFRGILVGQHVVITVAARRFSFAQPTVVYHVLDSFEELNFYALEAY